VYFLFDIGFINLNITTKLQALSYQLSGNSLEKKEEKNYKVYNE